MRNSLRCSFFENKEKNRVNTKAIPVKNSHQSGYCHHKGYTSGEKSDKISTKIKLGSAISNARGVNADNTVDGRTLCRMMRKPISPMPSRIATDSKLIRKIFIFLTTSNYHQILVDGQDILTIDTILALPILR